MDKAQPEARSWAPAFGLVTLAWLASAVAIAWFLLADDAPGRLLAAIGATGLVAAALFGSIARPRLSADNKRVTVRGLTGTESWPWQRVSRIRVSRHRRLGRDIPMLELDVLDSDTHNNDTHNNDTHNNDTHNADRDGTGQRLIILGRLDLNADPEDVLDAIQRIRGLI